MSSSTCSIQVCGGARRRIEAESAFRRRWFCCNGGRHGCKRRFLLGSGAEEGVLRGGAQECVQEARFGMCWIENPHSSSWSSMISDLHTSKVGSLEERKLLSIIIPLKAWGFMIFPFDLDIIDSWRKESMRPARNAFASLNSETFSFFFVTFFLLVE